MDAGRDENEVSGDSGLSIPDGSLGQRMLIYSDAKSNFEYQAYVIHIVHCAKLSSYGIM